MRCILNKMKYFLKENPLYPFKLLKRNYAALKRADVKKATRSLENYPQIYRHCPDAPACFTSSTTKTP